ncbi:glycosyltransferase family 2 protein [Oharaeibacter diazotrophicus]|nr:glycosyltransferase [Oharaeibacter diazotrophicus]
MPASAPAERARIAVIVPSRDNPGDLGTFVASLRATAAAADALDLVVVDNGGVLTETRALLDDLARSGVRVIAAPEPFNWSHLNNRAAATTDAPLLVFANDDMRMLTTGWDDVLRGLLARPEIGAVGVRMVYPDGTVQHAGFLAGWRGDGMIHDGVHEAGDAAGPDGRYLATRAVAAVTGAFLALRRADFEAVGGFDAVALPIAWSDVDLCFALRARGLAVVETPSIRLVHHESKSRGHEHESPERMARNAAERAVMAARWPEALARDPFANPWWVMDLMPFRLVRPPSAAVLAAHLARSASAAPWRISAPATSRSAPARA